MRLGRRKGIRTSIAITSLVGSLRREPFPRPSGVDTAGPLPPISWRVSRAGNILMLFQVLRGARGGTGVNLSLKSITLS